MLIFIRVYYLKHKHVDNLNLHMLSATCKIIHCMDYICKFGYCRYYNVYLLHLIALEILENSVSCFLCFMFESEHLLISLSFYNSLIMENSTLLNNFGHSIKCINITDNIVYNALHFNLHSLLQIIHLAYTLCVIQYNTYSK